MTTHEEEKVEAEREESSGWTRLPKSSEESASKRVAVRRALEQGAVEAAAVLGRGMRRAAEMVGAPSATELDSLVEGSDLPELGPGPDTLSALALRLDREADLWRALALKAMSRSAWADRTAHGASVVAAVGCVGLAGIAAMEALFSGATWHKALMVAVGGLLLVVGALVVGGAGSAIRRAQREVARESLARADLAELRLHRVAVVLAVRKEDPGAFVEALRRLEREVCSSAK